MQQIIARPGGKARMKREILKRAPPHDTYIEPFFGGGSVFFEKPRVKKEVINDADKELIDFYRACRTPGVSFRKANLRASRKRYDRHSKSKPKTPQGKVNRYLYLSKRGFGGNINGYSPSLAKRKGAGGRQSGIKNIGIDQQKRLRKVKIENKDFEKVIKDHDKKSAFIYMDPPYYKESKGMYKHDDSGASPERVLHAAKRAKGKVIITYNDSPKIRRLAHELGLHVSTEKITYALNCKSDRRYRKNLIITNYPRTKKKAVRTRKPPGKKKTPVKRKAPMIRKPRAKRRK